MMFTKKSLSVIVCLVCYVFSSNVFAHLNSMNMNMSVGDSDVNMSDCGMDVSTTTDKTTTDNCFEQCMGPYDDMLATTLIIPSHSDYYTPTNYVLLIHIEQDTLPGLDLSGIPPDDRCLIFAKQTPYFSHSNTTQTE